MGKKPDDILREFMSQWDIKKDGTINWEEFHEYYQAIILIFKVFLIKMFYLEYKCCLGF